MPIDEFGREIPAPGAPPSGIGGHPTPFADPLRNDDDSNRPSGGAGGANPLLMDGELSSRRDTSGGGGGRSRSPVGERRGGSPNGSEGRRRDYNDHHNTNDGRRNGGRGGRHHHRGRSRADSSGYEDRRRGGGSGRRHRSRSYGDNDDRGDDYHHSGGGRHNGSGRSHRGSSAASQNRSNKSHASERYAEQPMLCQFLWKKELEEEQAKLNKPAEGDAASKTKGDDASSDDAMDDTDNATTEANPQEEQTNKSAPAPLFESSEAELQAYQEYNTKYCLNYVRTFFNHHLDDPWFRTRLSPLETYRAASKERSRANGEAKEVKKEIIQSLEDMKSGVIPKKDPDCAEYLGPPMCNFVASCRLGVGTKPTSPMVRHNHHNYHNHYNEQQGEQQNETDMQHNVLQGEDRNRIERHAKSHLHSFIKSESCVKIMDVPSNVSDGQLLATLAEYCSVSKEPPTAVWSDSVCIPRHDHTSMDPYHRTAYAVFPSSSAKDSMLESLHKANEEANRRSRDRHRKGGDALPRILDLDVDCTDIYGRRELDADGKGAAPPSSSGKKKKDINTPDATANKLPVKRCTVYVSTSHLSSSQPVSVLSAAVSSRERIAQDKEDAFTVCGILDEVRNIEAGSRLNDLLHVLYPGNELRLADDEDLLDISIAYLRRVHLFSFYNGCTAATDVGDVLSFVHPSGTIHLRLRDADDILKKNAEERGAEERRHAALRAEERAEREANGDMAEKDGGSDEEANPVIVQKDMLVTRLNNSIARALETVKHLATLGPSILISPDLDAAAHTIESSEKNARKDWIANHGIFDEDGRARCAFHFCRKLFKDKAFLHKHSLKKHSDQLRSECAKCHDGPMMVAWDSDEHRPVPPVLIDCGSKFGLVPSPVTGNATPGASDPEPALWQEEQARMAEEERKHRERDAAIRAEEEEMEMQRRREMANANAGEKRKSNFVDPDDMVEEKVELSFENVVVAPPPKKKKKKKKSLL